MKLLIISLFICTVAAAPEYPPITLASVRDVHSGLPKCIGIFITPNVVLTTARCLFCDRECNFTVTSQSNEVSDSKLFAVESIVIHDGYEMDPQKHDIGFVKLYDEISVEAVIEIPEEAVDVTRFPAIAFRGKLNEGEYVIEPQEVKVLSNAKCSFALNYYVPEAQVCAHSNDRFHFKEQDQGTPLVYYKDNQWYLLGTFASDNMEFEHGARIVVYQSVLTHARWLNLYAKNIEPECTASSAPKADFIKVD